MCAFRVGRDLELFDVITGRVYLSLNTIKEEPEYSGLYTWKEEATLLNQYSSGLGFLGGIEILNAGCTFKYRTNIRKG